MKVTAWRAFYTEGREFTGRSLADFAALPGDGVLSIVLYHDKPRPDGKPYRTIVDGGNWYFAAQGERDIMYMCDNDTRESIALRYPGAIIKRGKGVDLESFKIVDAQAMAAIDCPDCGG